jgi:AraC-like DNA-binding protein
VHFKTELIQAGIAPVTPILGREASYRVNRIHIPLDGRAKYRDINGEKILERGFVYLLINGFSKDLSMLNGHNYSHMYLDFVSTPPLLSREMIEISLDDNPYINTLITLARLLIVEGGRPLDSRLFVDRESELFADLEEVLNLIMLYVYRNYKASLVENEKLEMAVRYIGEHYREPIHNADIAKGVGLDQRQLIRIFERYLKTTPYNYLTAYRIERAIHLLKSGKSVSETAELSGYQNEVAFRMAFKRIMGSAPTLYIKKQ